MKIVNKYGWYYYLSGKEKLLDMHKCGKWMHFFSDQEFAKEICKRAIEENICYECKCSNLEMSCKNTGVICFYCNIDDIDNNKQIIQFMLDNNLIPKGKDGKLHNAPFKLDDQTRAGLYGEYFVPFVSLEDYIDLKTGKFIK